MGARPPRTGGPAVSIRASFSAEEIALMHGVSPSKVRKLVASGVVARVPNLGRCVRIPYAEAEAKFGPIPAHVLEQLAGVA